MMTNKDMDIDLDVSYEIYLQDKPSSSKYSFLAEALFDFITYEYEISEKMARTALDVCKAISNKTTFDYIKADEYIYLIMVNMPFFASKIDWGTSIRGAFWVYKIELTSYELLNRHSDQVISVKFSKEEWVEFINHCIEWAEQEKGDD